MVTLLAIIALGFRVYALSAKWAHIDELTELFAVTVPSWDAFSAAIRGHGPFQSPLPCLLGFMAGRWTNDLAVLRLLPLLYGCGTAILAYLLGILLRGRMLAWLWSLLVCVSVLQVMVSDTLRPHAFFGLLALAMLYAFLTAPREGVAWNYGLVALLAQASWPEALFLGAALSVYPFFSADFAHQRRLWRALVPSWIVFALWFVSSGPVLHGRAYSYLTVLGPQALRMAVLQFAQGTPMSATVYGAFCLVAVWLALRGKGTPAIRLGLFVMASMTATLAAAHWVLRVPLLPWHLISVLPVYLGLVAAGLSALIERLSPLWAGTGHWSARLWTAAASLLIMAQGTATLRSYARQTESLTNHWLDSAAFLRGRLHSRDLVIAGNPNTGATFIHYFEPGAISRLRGVRLVESLVLFDFPPDFRLRVQDGDARMLTLCGPAPGLATVDRQRFQSLREETAAAGGDIWLLYLGSMNFMPERDPFSSALGIGWGEMSEPYPGIIKVAAAPGASHRAGRPGPFR